MLAADRRSSALVAAAAPAPRSGRSTRIAGFVAASRPRRAGDAPPRSRRRRSAASSAIARAARWWPRSSEDVDVAGIDVAARTVAALDRAGDLVVALAVRRARPGDRSSALLALAHPGRASRARAVARRARAARVRATSWPTTCRCSRPRCAPATRFIGALAVVVEDAAEPSQARVPARASATSSSACRSTAIASGRRAHAQRRARARRRWSRRSSARPAATPPRCSTGSIETIRERDAAAPAGARRSPRRAGSAAGSSSLLPVVLAARAQPRSTRTTSSRCWSRHGRRLLLVRRRACFIVGSAGRHPQDRRHQGLGDTDDRPLLALLCAGAALAPGRSAPSCCRASQADARVAQIGAYGFAAALPTGRPATGRRRGTGPDRGVAAARRPDRAGKSAPCARRSCARAARGRHLRAWRRGAARLPRAGAAVCWPLVGSIYDARASPVLKLGLIARPARGFGWGLPLDPRPRAAHARACRPSTATLPDLIDLLVVTVEAGLGFSARCRWPRRG